MSKTKFVIRHEIRGRMRIHLLTGRLTIRQADLFSFYLSGLPQVKEAKVYERTGDAAVVYTGDRQEMIAAILAFSFEGEACKETMPKNGSRACNAEFQEKLVGKVLAKAFTKLFFPFPIRAVYTAWSALPILVKGIQKLWERKLSVEVLDAVAVGVSMARGDFNTAGSVTFLLGIGELLEEWTHKKSVNDLAGSMSLHVERVWKQSDKGEHLVPISEIQKGDRVLVRMGTMIPLDGIVESGEAMVNQASMTGESMPVRKEQDMYVYAGTAVEEGSISIRVKKTAGSTRYERIVKMIEESEKLKSSLEKKASSLADALVPYSFLGTALTWILTGNVTKALSILMVDFSCALKLSMPLAVLSAMREASAFRITVKGGTYLEAVAKADTVVFDKTGTLTKAQPTVAEIVTFEGRDKNEMLRIAACLEEHFPHSIANAVVAESVRRGLVHEEMHSKVDYIVAHGIASRLGKERVIIGSSHFVFEDEGCVIPEGEEETFRSLPPEYSHLYLAISGRLAAVICIEDPLRAEAYEVIRQLKELGITKAVMMTGDSERTACAVAKKVGADEYYSEVLPEDKAGYIENEKKIGHTVIMVGDGINDSPALSAADAGIAISEGAEIAREIADITITDDAMYQLVTLKAIANGLIRRVNRNYRFVIAFNFGLIVLGVAGVLSPAASALLHNASTIGIGLESMTNLLDSK